jgi:hypothetical protein
MRFPTRPSAIRAAKFLGAASIAAVSLHTRPVFAVEVSSSWLSETDGTWTYAPAWSTNPNVPNNGGGSSYDAVLGGSGGNPYVVTLDSDITVNSLTISSDDALLEQMDGTFQGGTINISAGAYQMGSGTLSNSSVQLSGDGTFVTYGSVLNNLHVSGGDLVTGPESIVVQQGSLSIANTNLDLGGDAEFCFDGPSRTIDNLTIKNLQSGENTICVGGPTSGGSINLTLGSHFTAYDGVTFSNYTPGDGSGLINGGTLNADASVGGGITVNTDIFTNNSLAEATNGGYLQISSANWVNKGTLLAGAADSQGNGSTVDLEGNWRNAGTIEATDSSAFINLGGNFTDADIGTLITNGATVSITGTLDNTNATFKPSTYGGVFELGGGTISNGTLDISGGLTIYDGTFDNVHVTGGTPEIQADGELEVLDQLTVDSKNIVVDSGGKIFFGSANQTLDNISITPAGYAYLYVARPFDYTDTGTLTLGTNAIIHDGATITAPAGSTLINDGTLLADNTVQTAGSDIGIEVSIANFTNAGLVEASNGGVVTIESNVKLTNTGILEVQNGTIVASGGLNLGTGILGGNGTISGAVTVASGSTISAGKSISLGTGPSNSDGSISTGNQTWNGGGKYLWKIGALGTGGAAPGTGGSGKLGNGSGTEGTDWDQLAMGSLTIAAGGSNPSFTLSLMSISTLSDGSSRYSWVIAQTGSTSLPTFSAASQAYATGSNLLQYSPSGSGNDAFAINTSGFMIDGISGPPASSFSLEFEKVGGSTDYDLVLDENVSAAPEPGGGLLLFVAAPVLLRRRRVAIARE